MTRSSLHAPERVLDPAVLPQIDEMVADVIRQRDDLRAALKLIVERHNAVDLCGCRDCLTARAAIVKTGGH